MARNPHVNLGVETVPGNKNVFIHTPAEAFPRRGFPLTVLAMRLLSTLFGDNLVLECCAYNEGQLTLYWRADVKPAQDYPVFIQLWQNGEQIAGFDGPPLDGDFPTSVPVRGAVNGRHAHLKFEAT